MTQITIKQAIDFYLNRQRRANILDPIVKRNETVLHDFFADMVNSDHEVHIFNKMFRPSPEGT